MNQPDPQLSPIKESRPSQMNRRSRKKNTMEPDNKNQTTVYVNKVTYDSSNHWSVLTQMHGSIWPRVITFCIFNVLNTVLVLYLQEKYVLDVSFSDRGHTFMSMMVSFLMVTRSNIAYSRYMEARSDLSKVTIACRELISYATTFTRYDTTPNAKKWRIDLARRTIKLLRTVVTVLEFQSTGNHAWKVPALSREEKEALQKAVGKSNERSPMVLTMFVQSTIASHVEYLDPKKPLHPNKELKLYALVSDFVQAYHGLMKLVTTPFPFPLVQMTRTFLFIWVFTLPWVLVNDLQKLAALVFTVFFITYAFVGLELVAIELDDPFGDDDNDFDVLGLATVAFKDIYIYIYDLHGDTCTETKKLHGFMHEANKKSEQLDQSTRDELDKSHQGGYDSISSKSNRSGGVVSLSPTKKKNHRRWDSQQAWELAVDLPTVEAGSEHSFFLAKNVEVDFGSLPPYHKKNMNSNYGSMESELKNY